MVFDIAKFNFGLFYHFSSMTAVLFSYFRSSSAYRVRIALNLKKVPYEIRPVNLRTGEQNSSEFKAISPLGTVPVLQIDGHTFSQSLAIIDYLDATRKNPKMCCNDPVKRSRILACSLVMAADTQPLHNLYTLQTLQETASSLGAMDTQKVSDEWAAKFIRRGLAVVENKIGKYSTDGEFCIGKAVSLADACLAPQIYVAKRFGIATGEFPRCDRVYKHLMNLEEFIKAHPHNQPDCLSELKGDLSM